MQFPTLEDGINAHILMREKSAKDNKPIKDRLASWAVDKYDIPGIDTSKTYAELTKKEKHLLIEEQIKIESPGLYKEMERATA